MIYAALILLAVLAFFIGVFIGWAEGYFEGTEVCRYGIGRQLIAARTELTYLHEERKKLSRRIYNQRRAFRDTWEIVEKRRNWLGSQAAREHHIRLFKIFKRQQAELAELKKQLTISEPT